MDQWNHVGSRGINKDCEERAMEVFLFVAGGIVLVIVMLMARNFGKNPSRKTTSQLWREMDLHGQIIKNIPLSSPKLSKAIANMEIVENELKRRGEIAATAEQTQFSPEDLRVIADKGYAEGWSKAKARGKTDKQAHETALISTLLGRLQQEPGAPPISEQMVAALGMEVLPFNVISQEESSKAIIEYVVWREYPQQAEVEVVKRAINSGLNTMRETGGPDVVDGLLKGPFPWISLCD